MVIVLNCGCGYALIFDTKCGHNCSYNVFAPACYRGCHSEAILCVAVANQIAFWRIADLAALCVDSKKKPMNTDNRGFLGGYVWDFNFQK